MDALIDRSCSPLSMWHPWPLLLSSRANHCFCPRTILTPQTLSNFTNTLQGLSSSDFHMWGNTLVDFTIVVAATRIEPVQLGHRMSMSIVQCPWRWQAPKTSLLRTVHTSYGSYSARQIYIWEQNTETLGSRWGQLRTHTLPALSSRADQHVPTWDFVYTTGEIPQQ